MTQNMQDEAETITAKNGPPIIMHARCVAKLTERPIPFGRIIPKDSEIAARIIQKMVILMPTKVY